MLRSQDSKKVAATGVLMVAKALSKTCSADDRSCQ